MLLITSITLLGTAAILGTWLAGKYVLMEKAPARRWPGVVHGIVGAFGLVFLCTALSLVAPTAKAIRLGAGTFGFIAAAIVAMAFIAGLSILGTHCRRQPPSVGLIATHGLLGIIGYTLLVTYLTMLH